MLRLVLIVTGKGKMVMAVIIYDLPEVKMLTE